MEQTPRPTFEVPGAQGAASFVQGVYRQPSIWARIIGVLVLLVIGVPMLALLLLIAIVSAAVFIVLAMWAALTGSVRASRGPGQPPKPGQDDSGRRNVRVRR